MSSRRQQDVSENPDVSRIPSALADALAATNLEPIIDALATTSLEAIARIGFESLLENSPGEAMERNGAMRQMVSTSTATLTGSPVAKELQAATFAPSADYVKLDAGSFGIIFQQAGTLDVLKISQRHKPDIWREYLMQIRIHKAFQSLSGPVSIDIRIPQPKFFLSSVDESGRYWWKQNIHAFPPEEKISPEYTIVMERILPMTDIIRKGLTRMYCPENNRQAALDNPKAKHCLARVILGRRRKISNRPPQFFSLRNINLNLDQLYELQAEVDLYAKAMAQTLAVMHWKVQCNARDVEFVIGSTPPSMAEAQQTSGSVATLDALYTFQKRSVHLWMLDFNQVRIVSMDRDGVKEIVAAFTDNEPYFPKPRTDKDQAL